MLLLGSPSRSVQLVKRPFSKSDSPPYVPIHSRPGPPSIDDADIVPSQSVGGGVPAHDAARVSREAARAAEPHHAIAIFVNGRDEPTAPE